MKRLEILRALLNFLTALPQAMSIKTIITQTPDRLGEREPGAARV